jgi:hypothetical protein
VADKKAQTARLSSSQAGENKVLKLLLVLCPTNKLQNPAQGLSRQRSLADQTAVTLFKLISGTLH